MKSNKKKGKKKGQDDDVVDGAIGMGGVSTNDFGGPKGKRRRGKDKNKQDDLLDSGMPGDPPKKSKSRKGRDDHTTTQNGTEYGTNPTQKDFL